jgi:ubiquinone/menaquinone biosynthesis C-methylase UbiE
MSKADRLRARDYYDILAEGEWLRLEQDVIGRVALEVHRRFLGQFIKPGMKVLEIGAGPGRFTIELAARGAFVLVTDFSATQLNLNRQMVSPTAAEQMVLGRALVDVCDTTQFAEDEFDAVVAYGGPLSYAFEQIESALSGLLRIAKPGGPVVASVMSVLGTWRHFLPGVLTFAEESGEEANDQVLATGDLRLASSAAHQCKMFRSQEVLGLIASVGGKLLAGSASNWCSMNPAELLQGVERDSHRWDHFLANEVLACRERGAWDGGTHFLFAYGRG